MVRIGVISDTHGMVRNEVHTVFAGVDRILHAGDVGGADVLAELRLIAPVQAVLGNTDDPHELALPWAIDEMISGLQVHVSHGHELGRPRAEQLAERYAADVIIYGHTHRQAIVRLGNRVVINPGAAGAKRFELPPSVAILRIEDKVADVELVELA